MNRRGKLWLRWGLSLVLIVVVVAAIIVIGQRTADDGAPPPPTSQPTTSNQPQQPPVLAVKIDNLPQARPQTGLSQASAIYVEPVEGGLTRLVAIYDKTLPDSVGPVRSARSTDLELLTQFGKPTLAYSGAAPQLLPALHSGSIVNASPNEVANAYTRRNNRPAPHNLYLDPRKLPTNNQPPTTPVFEFGDAPAEGASTGNHSINYPAATFGFSWSADESKWLVSADGKPMTSTEAGRLTASTVIEQKAGVRTGDAPEDAQGNSAPIAETVGNGGAVVLRDGQRFDATWNRADANAPTRFYTSDGRPLPLAAGPVWVVLVPG